MNDDNIAHRHRHGQSWEQQREDMIRRDYKAMRWVIFGLVLFWVGIILLLARCGR
jgi:hypothetical protein